MPQQPSRRRAVENCAPWCRSLGARDAHRAFLEIGLQRYRVGRVERHLIDELALVEPRHEDHTVRHLIASTRFKPRADEASTRFNPDLVTAAHVEFCRIIGMHETDSIRK